MAKNQTFGEQVKAYRKTHGLTQKQFAELVGIDQPRISRIEKGEDIYLSTYEKISKIIDGEKIKSDIHYSAYNT